jgi:hypothetical protein
MKEVKKYEKHCHKHIIEVCFDSEVQTDTNGERIMILHQVIKCNGEVASHNRYSAPASAMATILELRRRSLAIAESVGANLVFAAHKAMEESLTDLVKEIHGLDMEMPLNIAQQAKFLCEYERFHIMLKDAKKLYRENKNRKQWRRIIKAAYPELPDTIIGMLRSDGRAKYEDAPSELALLHTANLFGLQPYSRRHLKRLLKEWKERYPEPATLIDFLEKIEKAVTQKKAS